PKWVFFCPLLLSFLITPNILSKAQINSIFSRIDKIELMGGISSTTFIGRDWENNDIKIGYSGGIGGTWDLNEKTAIDLMIILEKKGIKFSSDVYYYDEVMQQHKGKSTSITNLNYLSLPILFQYHFNWKKFDGLLIELGPYVSYLYKAQAISEFSWKSKEVYNRKEDFKDFDFGSMIRVGYSFNIKNNFAINLWTNVTYGLINLGKDSGATGF